MITPDETQTPEPAAAGASEIPVPLPALAVDDAVPAEGDEVEFTVRAKVARVEGPLAFVAPLAINGQPIELPAASPAEADPMAEALKADNAAV